VTDLGAAACVPVAAELDDACRGSRSGRSEVQHLPARGHRRGRVALTRESPVRRDPLTIAYTFSYGATQRDRGGRSVPTSACVRPRFARPRSSGSHFAILSATGHLPAGEQPGGPDAGHLFTGEAAGALHSSGRRSSSSSPVSRSRAAGIAPSCPKWSCVAGPRGPGVRRSTDQAGAVNFVPVEQRFYAARPDDVRGLPLQPVWARSST
jgi:hypothetical protein